MLCLTHQRINPARTVRTINLPDHRWNRKRQSKSESARNPRNNTEVSQDGTYSNGKVRRESLGVLSPEEYKARTKELSNRWKAKSKEDRHPYVAQAHHEQQLRAQLSSTPLGTQGSGKTELEIQVGRAGCKKVSAKRLAVNENSFFQHPTWSSPTQLGDGFLSRISNL